MNRIISILTLIFITLSGLAQTNKISGEQFELKGAIINEISLPPRCGIFAWGTVIEFEIVDFSDSTYALDSIGLIFMCPEFYEKGFFEVGKTYLITVSDENPADFTWTIPNESILTKYNLNKKLWVVKVDRIK